MVQLLWKIRWWKYDWYGVISYGCVEGEVLSHNFSFLLLLLLFGCCLHGMRMYLNSLIQWRRIHIIYYAFECTSKYIISSRWINKLIAAATTWGKHKKIPKYWFDLLAKISPFRLCQQKWKKRNEVNKKMFWQVDVRVC